MKNVLLAFMLLPLAVLADDETVPRIYNPPIPGVAHIPPWVTHENTVPRNTARGRALVAEVTSNQTAAASAIPLPSVPDWVPEWRTNEVAKFDAETAASTNAILSEVSDMSRECVVFSSSPAVGGLFDNIRDRIEDAADDVRTVVTNRIDAEDLADFRRNAFNAIANRAGFFSSLTNRTWTFVADGITNHTTVAKRFTFLTNELHRVVRRARYRRRSLLRAIPGDDDYGSLSPFQLDSITNYHAAVTATNRVRKAARDAVFDALPYEDRVTYRAQKSAAAFWSTVADATNKHARAMAAWTNSHVMVDGKWIQRSKMQSASRSLKARAPLTEEQKKAIEERKRQRELEKKFRELSGDSGKSDSVKRRKNRRKSK